jgi:hypothetical protein
MVLNQILIIETKMPLSAADRVANQQATHFYHAYESAGDTAFNAGEWADAKSKYEAAKRNRERSRDIHINAGIADPGDHAGAILVLQEKINQCQIRIDAEAYAAAEAHRIATLAASGSSWGRRPNLG